MDAVRSAAVIFLMAWSLAWLSAATTTAGDHAASENRAVVAPRSAPASVEPGPQDIEEAGAGQRLSRQLDLLWDGATKDAGDALVVQAGEIIERESADGQNAPNNRVVELRGDVRFRLQGSPIQARADRAVVAVKYQDAAQEAVESLTVNLSGHAHTLCDGIGVSADALVLDFRPLVRAKPADAPQTRWTVRGRARLSGKNFVARADRVELARDADDARQTAHLVLEGNAALKFTGKSHGQTRGDRLEFWRVKQGVVPSLSDLIGGALK